MTTVDIDTRAFELELGKFIFENALAIAEQISADAKATTLFKDKTGTLRKKIRVRKSKYDGGGYIVVASAPHAHLVEYGHALVRNVKTIGRIAPRPFLRSAKDKNIEAARRAFGAE